MVTLGYIKLGPTTFFICFEGFSLMNYTTVLLRCRTFVRKLAFLLSKLYILSVLVLYLYLNLIHLSSKIFLNKMHLTSGIVCRFFKIRFYLYLEWYGKLTKRLPHTLNRLKYSRLCTIHRSTMSYEKYKVWMRFTKHPRYRYCRKIFLKLLFVISHNI